MKKVLSIILSLTMLLSITAGIDFSAYSATLSSSGSCGENVTYTFDSSTGTLTISGSGDMYDYNYNGSPFYWNNNIKTVIIEDGVTSIGRYAFCKCSSLTNTTIPDSVTSIGGFAFGYCSSLTNITIPDSVTSIGKCAFDGCSSLTNIAIPDSVTSIGDYAFGYCSSLTNITIPDSVTSIGDYAFYLCSSLTSVTIGNSVTSIGSFAFDNCSSLKKVDYTGTIDDWCGISFGDSTSNPTCYAKNLYINDVLLENAIISTATKISDYAFYNCNSITSVTIGNSVTSIGGFAFEDCSSLTNITIPDSVTSIGEYAFSGCSSITNVTIGNSVINIGEYAFSGCSSITSVTIGNSVTSISNFAFYYCSSLTSVIIPDSVTSIGEGAFDYCESLKAINVSENNKYYSSIDGVLFDKGQTTLIQYPCGSKTIEYIIPNSVTSIGDSAFYNCSSLTSVTIGNSVTSISDFAFYNCESLTSITIPDSVTSIGFGAFADCSSLINIIIPDSVTSIGDYAFFLCYSLTSVTIPDSVTNIGEYAFYYCESLTSIAIPDSVTSIGESAFEVCINLTDVYYSGTEEDWNNIDIEDHNEYLLNATIHYACTTHSWNDGKITKNPTCTSTGVMTYTCTVCGDSYTEEIAMLAHTPANAVEENRVEPTCTVEGSYDSVVYCSVCNTELSRDTNTISATGHKEKSKVTKATTKANGKITYTCSVCGETTKKATTIYYPKTITLSATSYTYDGKTKKPTVTIKDSKGNKIATSNYTVTYASGCKNVGNYNVTIKFKGNYSGTVTKTFKINPKGTTISKLTATSKGFKSTWKKQATQTTGYQIQYSTSSNFKNAKTVNVSKNSTTSTTVSKLSAKKKYYVRIRTYKTVNGTKYYSSWSSSKTVTTKK